MLRLLLAMTVLATDNFDRVNANPIGAPWTTGNGESAMQIVSNVATPSTTAADCGSDYTGITWPADQYSKAKLTVSGTTGGASGVSLKVRSASGARTYYRLDCDHAATNNITLEKFIASVPTTLAGFPLTLAWTDGDTWELWAVGTRIWVLRNGVLVGAAVTDSAIASGNPGMGYSSTETSASINDWEGGTVDSAAPIQSRYSRFARVMSILPKPIQIAAVATTTVVRRTLNPFGNHGGGRQGRQ